MTATFGCKPKVNGPKPENAQAIVDAVKGQAGRVKSTEPASSWLNGLCPNYGEGLGRELSSAPTVEPRLLTKLN